MKKTIACLLMLALILALCACGGGESAEKTEAKMDSAQEQPAEEKPVEAEEKPVEAEEKPAEAEEKPVETEEPEPEKEGPAIIEFQDVVLAEDELVRIELSNFFEKETRWASGTQIEKCLTYRVTNKGDKELLIYLEDTYIDDEGVNRSGLDGVGVAPKPGKSDSYAYRIYYKSPAYENGKPLDSLEDLYRLEASFEICIKEDNRIIKTYYLDFSLPELLGAAPAGTAADGGDVTAGAAVMETAHMKINGFCVDDSYRDKDNSPLRMVYLFYTFTATDENLEIDSKYTTLRINEKNEYTSDHYASFASAAKYMPNYLYTSYIQKVYLGTSVNVTATFMIPEGDLTPGRSLSLSDTQNPDAEKISFTTDVLQHFNSGEEIAKAFDPEGYETVLTALEEADAQTTAQVKTLINGYFWWCYVNNTKYEVEFYADQNFEVRTSLGTSNSGTYSVRKGYLVCTYSNGLSIEIPYEIKNGDVEMDLLAAFDVMG